MLGVAYNGVDCGVAISTSFFYSFSYMLLFLSLVVVEAVGRRLLGPFFILFLANVLRQMARCHYWLLSDLQIAWCCCGMPLRVKATTKASILCCVSLYYSYDLHRFWDMLVKPSRQSCTFAYIAWASQLWGQMDLVPWIEWRRVMLVVDNFSILLWLSKKAPNCIEVHSLSGLVDEGGG